MDQLWTWLKHADAKTLFLASIGLFVVVLTVVGWQHFGCTASQATAPQPAKALRLQEGATTNGTRALMALVSNQLSADALTVPLDPFRPDITDLPPTHSVTNTPPRRRRNAMTVSTTTAEAKEDAPIIPRLTFHGYFQRPDGAPAAFFSATAPKISRFLTAGETLQGVTLLNADIRTAKIRLPNGETTNLNIGASVTLQ